MIDIYHHIQAAVLKSDGWARKFIILYFYILIAIQTTFPLPLTMHLTSLFSRVVL